MQTQKSSQEQIETLQREGKRATRSKKEALKTLQKAGIATGTGRLKKIYRPSK